MEESGIVPVVCLVVKLTQAWINVSAVGQQAKGPVILDPTVFADTQKDQPVDGALDAEVQFAGSE